MRHDDPGRLAAEEELSHAGVRPGQASPAYEGAPVIQAERLLTPEEGAHERPPCCCAATGPSMMRTAVAVNVGAILCALAYVLFQAPNNLATGGASGMAIVISTLVPALPSDVALWAVNAALVVVGLIFVERRAVIWSIVASILLSAYVSVLQALVPMSGSLTGDLWIDLVCSLVLVAAGTGIAYNAGASTGGTDILVMALARHTSLPTGHAITVVNAVTACSGVALYGVRDGRLLHRGPAAGDGHRERRARRSKQHKVCTVVCRQPARVQEFVVRRLARTATVWLGYGAYTGRELSVVMTVLTRSEAPQAREVLAGD